MLMTIEICRETDAQTGRSRLRAYVLAELFTATGEKREVRGADLLVRRYTRVDSALARCAAVIAQTYRLIEAPELTYRLRGNVALDHHPRAAALSAPSPPALPPGGGAAAECFNDLA
jgi:hypothetical protein